MRSRYDACVSESKNSVDWAARVASFTDVHQAVEELFHKFAERDHNTGNRVNPVSDVSSVNTVSPVSDGARAPE